MNKILKLKFTLTQILLLILISILIYVIYTYSGGDKTTSDIPISNPTKNTNTLSVLKDPAFIVAIISLVFTYLIIDRWKSIESRIEKLKDEQNISIKGIEDRADKQIDDKVDKMIDRAETIDRKVSSLIESHPWIGLITENNIIPDIPTCHVVIETATKLLALQNDKRALVQEYIYFWVGKRVNHQKKNDEKTMPLEGTSEDFLRLVDFCEDKLNDKYLAFLVLQAGYSFTRTLSPYYLKRLINYGYIHEANKVVVSLKNSIKITLLAKIIAIFNDRYYMNADFQSRCLALIGLFESIKGREKNSQIYITKALALATKTKTNDFITCIKSEIHYYNGDYDLAFDELSKVDQSKMANEIRKYVREMNQKINASESMENTKEDASEVSYIKKTDLIKSIIDAESRNIKEEITIVPKNQTSQVDKEISQKDSKNLEDNPGLL